MESGSQVETLTEPPSRLANIAGTLIALITLILPVVAIAYYSASPSPIPTPNTMSPAQVPPVQRGL